MLAGKVRQGTVMINERPHYGFAHPGGKLSLDHKALFTAWIAKLAGTTGAEVVLFVADKAWLKTRAQERGFHALIAPWARECGYAIEDLKRFLLGEIFGYLDTVSPLTGERLLVEPHTSTLSKRQYSELIERTLDIAATKDDMRLEAPDEYRERKAKTHKQAATVAS